MLRYEQNPDETVEIDGELYWFECETDYIDFMRIRKIKRVMKKCDEKAIR